MTEDNYIYNMAEDEDLDETDDEEGDDDDLISDDDEEGEEGDGVESLEKLKEKELSEEDEY